MIAASSHVLFFYLSKVYPNGYIAVGYLLFLQEQIRDHHHLVGQQARAFKNFKVQVHWQGLPVDSKVQRPRLVAEPAARPAFKLTRKPGPERA
jgi:hypothetical protein